MKTNYKVRVHPVFILAEISNKMWMNPHFYMAIAVSCTSSMADYFWVLKCCNMLTLTFSNLPRFTIRRRYWGKCESTSTNNCTKRVRSVLTDILVLHIRSKYQMNGTVAPICSCSCLLGNRDPATFCNVGNYATSNKITHPKIILILNLHSLLFSWTKYDTK
jgi:hypothetical protein